MKRTFLLAAALFIALASSGSGQKLTFGPHHVDYGINQQQWGTNSGPHTSFHYYQPYLLFRRDVYPSDAYLEVRFFCDWNIPVDSTYYSYSHPTPQVAWARLRHVFHSPPIRAWYALSTNTDYQVGKIQDVEQQRSVPGKISVI